MAATSPQARPLADRLLKLSLIRLGLVASAWIVAVVAHNPLYGRSMSVSRLAGTSRSSSYSRLW